MPEMNPYTRQQPQSNPSQGTAPSAPKSKPSVISSELKIVGNLHTTDEIIIEGKIEGDLSARSVSLKETAEFDGHIRVDEAIIDGSLKGEIRGKKIRLNKTARVVGNIIHGNIQIEAGAHFEGNVKRSEDPIGYQQKKGNQQDKPNNNVATGSPAASPSIPKPSSNGFQKKAEMNLASNLDKKS